MKNWNSLTHSTKLKRYKRRRITEELEYKARLKEGITQANIDFLDSLLKIQIKYPQLTQKQWDAFKRTFLE